MKLKLTILTTLVALLTALSIDVVYTNPDKRPVDFALTNAAENESFNSQTAYILSATEPNRFPVRQPEAVDPALFAKAYLLYESENGKTILAHNSKQPLPVASLTKLLTAILVLENMSTQEAVTINATSRNVDGEGADFFLGEKIYVKDLLAAMMIKSSNDAAVALAEAVEIKSGGHFPEMMNRKAYEIGMVNSFFLDPAGLDDEAYSTAEDLLKLVKYSKRYPELWQWMGSPSGEVYSVDGRLAHTFFSTNKLFESWIGIVGGKTGYTEGALGCMILEVRNSGHGSLLAIVLGSSGRFEDTRKLIEWGLASFRWE